MRTKKTPKNQKRIMSVAFFFFLVTLTFAQTGTFPAQLPKSDLQTRPEHQYQVAADYLNYDIYGNFTGKLRIAGTYTSGLDGGTARWNNVHQIRVAEEKAAFPYGEPLTYMENFTYTYDQDILSAEFFANFPTEAVEAKNLVWDMAGMEYFAWGHTDSLRLNVPFHAREANTDMDLAGIGHFENRNIILTWKGMTEENGRLLAMIDYRTFNNPLGVEIDMGDRHFSTKGRSHYWGTIWLDMEQKCIDHIELFEDVVLEIGWDDQPEKQLVDVVREMKVTKIY
ncbi:MAG: hypothetical protein AB7U05_12785 [Mangrovibacterium sp.]